MESAVSPIAMFYDDHQSGSQCSQARPRQEFEPPFKFRAASVRFKGRRDSFPVFPMAAGKRGIPTPSLSRLL
jgi:hypothetical protein